MRALGVLLALCLLVSDALSFLQCPLPTGFRSCSVTAAHALRARPLRAINEGGDSDRWASAPDSVSAADLLQRIQALRAGKAAAIEEEQLISTEMARIQREQKELRQRLKTVFVLIFNPGQSSEGIYTLWLDDQNIVLGFECRQDAVRYALMLKAMEFHSPSPQEQDVRELKEFCIGAAVGLQLVPTGAGLTPPEANKPELGYDPADQPRRRVPSADVDNMFTKGDAEAMKQRFNQLYTSSDDA